MGGLRALCTKSEPSPWLLVTTTGTKVPSSKVLILLASPSSSCCYNINYVIPHLSALPLPLFLCIAALDGVSTSPCASFFASLWMKQVPESESRLPSSQQWHKKPRMTPISKQEGLTEIVSSPLEPTMPFRFRSQYPTQTQFEARPTSQSSESHRQEKSPSRTPSPGRGAGDVLLQWGHKKRSRVSRAEIRALTDESFSSAQARQASKLQRRDKSMPPPPPPPPSTSSATSSFSNGRLRKEASGLLPSRNLEDRSGVVNRSPSRTPTGANSSRAVSRSTAGKRSPPPDKNERKLPPWSGRSSAKADKPNGPLVQVDRVSHADSTALQSDQLAGAANPAAAAAASTVAAAAAAEKVDYEVVEWPRIYVALSRKEKEDDFLAMKGTKLPQRPKKRAKNVDRTLQYCFPGMWLSDLTRNRYEVREKKCVKKQKRRGLKGMESVDSDSD